MPRQELVAAHSAQLATTARSALTVSETARQDTFVPREQKIIGPRPARPAPTGQPHEERSKVIAAIVLPVTTVWPSKRSLLPAQRAHTVTLLEATLPIHPKVPPTLA